MSETATQVEGTAVCRLCDCGFVESGRAALTGRHGPAGRAAQTLTGNLGQSVEARGFSQEETKDFYRALKEEKADGPGRMNYKTIRAVLVKKLTDRRVKRFASQVEVEILPKSVLLSRGWDEATIDRFEKEHSPEYGCEVFKVPTRKLTWSEVFETVQEQLLLQEKAINMSKAQAKKEDMDLPAAEAEPAGRKGGGNAEKAQAQAAKRMQAANSKLAQEAGKWIAPLRKVPDALGKVLTQAQKAGERFQGTQEDLDLLEELMRKAQLWGDAASRTLLLDQQNKDAEKAGVASTPLEPLPFGGKDAKLFQKQAQAAAAAVRGNIRKKEAPARQGGGDDPAPKRRRKCKGGA